MGFGLFGKVPQKRDFISTGMPSAVLRPFETWLQSAVAASRDEIGKTWPDYYLVAPFWRMWFGPEIFGVACAGVIMPSVDQVGRYFPLAIMYIADPDEALPSPLVAPADWWYRAIEQRLLSVLDANDSADVSGLLTGLPNPGGFTTAPSDLEDERPGPAPTPVGTLEAATPAPEPVAPAEEEPASAPPALPAEPVAPTATEAAAVHVPSDPWSLPPPTPAPALASIAASAEATLAPAGAALADQVAPVAVPPILPTVPPVAPEPLFTIGSGLTLDAGPTPPAPDVSPAAEIADSSSLASAPILPEATVTTPPAPSEPVSSVAEAPAKPAIPSEIVRRVPSRFKTSLIAEVRPGASVRDARAVLRDLDQSHAAAERCYWWRADPEGGFVEMQASRGLPDAYFFSFMLGWQSN